MKIICIAGAPGSDVDRVAGMFAAAGMQLAQPLRQDPTLTLATWHEKVLAAGDCQAARAAVPQPGRFWEQLATNLFMENMRHALWGWADARSVWLLDFWQQFEPNLHFVLLYISPQRALAEALAAEGTHGADTASLMADWEAHQREILRFHHRNPKRSILVDAAECGVAPAALLDACAARWNLDLAAAPGQLPAPQPAAPLVGYLAEQLCQTDPKLQVLQQELEASLHPLLPETTAASDAPGLLSAVEDYRQIRNAAVLRAQQLDAELAQALAERQGELSALKTAHAEARSECEQLVLQMHQLQEEMERWYLENRQLAEIKATKRRRIEELSAELAQSALEAAALKRELDAARHKLERLEAERPTLADKGRLDAASREAEASRADAEAARRSAREAQQESELLLVQLHQVQEELEHYFLEHKSVLRQNDELQLRWQRMLERDPGYCDYRSLDLLSQDGARSAWRFTDLNAAGRAFPELRFDIVASGGVAAFAFAREGGAPGAPEALDSLGTADWMLLPALCRMLDDALGDPVGSVAQLGDEERDALRAALAGLLDRIEAMPAALRFDRIALKREQVNPDYEHLWLQLDNLSLGEQRWSDFEFRLSCANVRPGKFGAHPKLEFPSGAGAVLFDSWFVESYDDFGEKLELRFALPEAMDMSVWEQLSQADRDMMKRLIAILPRALARLEESKPSLARPYAEWQQLATAVQVITALRTGAAASAPGTLVTPTPGPAPASIPLPPQQATRTKKALAALKGTIK